MARPRVVDRDLGYRALVRRMNTLSTKPSVKVGFLADKNEERSGDGNGGSEPPTNVAVAAANEFGTRRIPARPFIGSTFDSHAAEYEQIAAKILGAVVDGSMGADKGLEIMGMKAASDIKATVTNGAGVPPPNAPATVERKGHERPLIGGSVKDNYAGGQMVGAVTWAVAKPGE